jgi:hypothetical protein
MQGQAASQISLTIVHLRRKNIWFRQINSK